MSDLMVGQPEPLPAVEEEEAAPTLTRDRDLLGRSNSRIRKKLDELFAQVSEGYEKQSDRSNDQMDYWDCYNCQLNDNQTYNGNAQIYVPIIRDAINARATRFVNQLFPQSGRYVEAITDDGSTNNELIALLDHYIRNAKFKTNIAKPLSRNGDVEGHYNVYIDWNVTLRTIVSRETHGPIDPQTGAEVPGPEIEDIVEEEVAEAMPGFEVLHDADVLVLPATADTTDEALARGGSISIVRRWSKTKIEQMRDDGHIREDEADTLIETMGKVSENNKDIEKNLVEQVGIRAKGKEAVVWEVWTCIKLSDKGEYSDKGTPRLCRVYFGPDRVALGCKRNPYWNDRCPLLSVPLEKIAGVFKGDSPIRAIASLQYEANDAANEMADADHYGALPIVARDPEKYDGPMVLNLAAIWDIEPGAVKFMEFPDLGPRGLRRIQSATQAIFQALGVNPAMLPQQTGRPGAKRNQAEIANEQSVDLLTTAEAVSVLEEGIFTPAMGWIVDLDYQFRNDELSVRMFGEMGKAASMQKVAPLQNRSGFEFVWRGGEQARNASNMQQAISLLNVLRPLRQDLMAEGTQLRLTPAIEAIVRNMLGPIIGGKTVVDARSQLTIQPDEENEMLMDGFMVPVHPLDDDVAHVQAHQQAMKQTGDMHGTLRVHLQEQLKQMQAKQQGVMMQKMQQQMQGAAGGQAPGRPGLPPPGASPAGPHAAKGPPGTVHPDQLPRAGVVQMPRKM